MMKKSALVSSVFILSILGASGSVQADTSGGRLVSCFVASVNSKGLIEAWYRHWAGGSLGADTDRLYVRACSSALRTCVKDLTRAMKNGTNDAGVVGSVITPLSGS